MDQCTILVTGGATGIGLALAERFLADGHTVAVCGRRRDKLAEAQAKHPSLVTFACDVGSADDRARLRDWALSTLPALDVLVNNAGVQRRDRFVGEVPSWPARQAEIAVNLEAPIHLADLFLPHLLSRPAATIVNVTSGLAFVPSPFAAVYGATKAALHSYTMSLRHHLSASNVRVVEIVPPMVQTDLGGAGLHHAGVPLDEFADAVMARYRAGELEIGYQFAEAARSGSRADSDAAFARFCKMVPVG
jgi:uncharacterized oxidoreductase